MQSRYQGIKNLNQLKIPQIVQTFLQIKKKQLIIKKPKTQIKSKTGQTNTLIRKRGQNKVEAQMCQIKRLICALRYGTFLGSSKVN